MDKQYNKNYDEEFFNIMDDKVKKYVQKGASLPQAVTLVCDKYNFNPYKVIDVYYPEVKNSNEDIYKDVKTEEGSFVTLNKDKAKNQYEVINIGNKDAIVLRNIDNNEEITASETEITPVVMENVMNKLNEAQYNISINGLESEDAGTLSQMLSLANQAESSAGSELATPDMQSDMAVTPMPMDTATGMPMDMEEPSMEEPSMEEPMADDMGMPMDMDEPSMEDDIEFDEELPMDTPMEEPMEEPSMDTPMEEPSMEEPSMEEPMADDMDMSMDMDEPSMEDDSDIVDDMNTFVDDAMESDIPVEDETIDDMIDDGMYENVEDVDAMIDEAIASGRLEEAETTIPGDDEFSSEQDKFAREISGSEGSVDEEVANQLKDLLMDDNGSIMYDDGTEEGRDALFNAIMDYLPELNEDNSIETVTAYAKWLDENSDKDSEENLDEEEMVDNFDEEIAEALRNAGIELDEAFIQGRDEIDDGQDINEDEIINAIDEFKNSGIDEDEAIKQYADMASLPESTVKEIYKGYSEDEQVDESAIESEMPKNPSDAEYLDSFDDEIEEALRIAGVELNEEKASEPRVVTDKTLYRNKDENKDDQEYNEVETSSFGKDGSEGMKKSMTFESTVNKNKIKSIYETAKSMYAKKDSKEWLALDRRYVEKLIKEGVSYNRANKMLMEAKKGK